MNVDITPGLADVSRTSGLCGNFDGDSDNDGETEPHPRTSSFRLLKEESLIAHRFVRLRFITTDEQLH